MHENAHHKPAARYFLMQKACQGLEYLSHGAVPYYDEPLPGHALREV